MSSILTETELMAACRTLFGDELMLSRDFLRYLQPTGVKAAYRLKAKEAHPDRFADSSPHVKQQQTVFFQEINKAYDLLRSFFQERERGAWEAPPGSHHKAKARAHRHADTARKSSCRIPERTLEFGHYLYHRGLISYPQLIHALVWQRQQRPVLGELAVHLGWLRKEDALTIIKQRGPYARFGERAIRLGMLSPGQVKALIIHQRSLHKRLGQYFVEKGLLSAGEIEHLAQKLTEHNARVSSRQRHRHKQAL
ncbi:MAG: J domain-containing protein [Desulfuromonas sp.]|nr:MAG: J domain-containing protein [Desulfuromonas sp.]